MNREIKFLSLFVMLAFGAVLISGCLGDNNNGSTGGTSDLYPGSQSYSFPAGYYSVMDIPSEGVTVKAYKTSGADIQTILSWYENKMNSSGWEFQEKYPVTTVSASSTSVSFGGVLFKKGDTGEGIWAWRQSSAGSSETFYVIATGPWSKFSGSGEADQLPSSDQAQGDEPIQRYPGSVMTSYEKDVSDPLYEKIYVDYGTSDGASAVADWYKQQLQSNGWTLDEESSDDTGYSLSFSKGVEDLQISVFKPSETTAYTEIDILYTKEGLPDTDQTAGYEPASRYPGSVMLEYQNESYGGVIAISITYGTSAGVSDVVNWYNSNMPGDGWTSVSTNGSPDDRTLVFSKASSTMLTIEVIQKTAYTEIDVSYWVSP
ncbi:MAG: hypothetical protein DRN33_05325 [Thermoplasmata archaeon]|nr:MAG: hypothetical protein DRN33_05325 [Thermoplasmata archaeon]